MAEVHSVVVKAKTLERIKVPRRSKSNHVLDSCDIRSTDFTNELLPILQSSYKLPGSDKELNFKEAFFIQSTKLQEDYLKRKNEMRQTVTPPGVSMDLKEYFGFYPVSDFRSILTIAENGICTDSKQTSRLGCSDSGVSLCLNADVIRGPKESDITICAGWIVICKYIRGRVNYVIESNDPLDPTVEFDCHISSKYSTLNVEQANVFEAFGSSQIYLFEFNKDFDIVKRPRQILPTAAVQYVFSKNRITFLQRQKTIYNLMVSVPSAEVVQKRSLALAKRTSTVPLSHSIQNSSTEDASAINPNGHPSPHEESVSASIHKNPAEETMILDLRKESRELLAHQVRTQLGLLRTRVTSERYCYMPVASSTLVVKDMPNFRFTVELRAYCKRFILHPLLNQPTLEMNQLVSWEILNKYLNAGGSHNGSGTTSTGYANTVIDHRCPKVLPRSHIEQKLHTERVRAWNNQQRLKKAKEEPVVDKVPDSSEVTTSPNLPTTGEIEEDINEESEPPLPLIAQYLRAVCMDTAYSRGAMMRFCSLLCQNEMAGIVNLQVASDTLCIIFPDSNYARSLGIPEAPTLEVNYLHMLLISRDGLSEASSSHIDVTCYIKELQSYHHQLTLLAHAQQQMRDPSSTDILDPYFRCNFTTGQVKEFLSMQNSIQQKSLFQELRGSGEKLSYDMFKSTSSIHAVVDDHPPTFEETVSTCIPPNPDDSFQISSYLDSETHVVDLTNEEYISTTLHREVTVPESTGSPLLTLPISSEISLTSTSTSSVSDQVPNVGVEDQNAVSSTVSPDNDVQPIEAFNIEQSQKSLEESSFSKPITEPCNDISSDKPQIPSEIDVDGDEAQSIVSKFLATTTCYSSASSEQCVEDWNSTVAQENLDIVKSPVNNQPNVSKPPLLPTPPPTLSVSISETVSLGNLNTSSSHFMEHRTNDERPPDWYYSLETVDRALDAEVALCIISVDNSFPLVSQFSKPVFPDAAASPLPLSNQNPSSIFTSQPINSSHFPTPSKGTTFEPHFLGSSSVLAGLERALRIEVETASKSSRLFNANSSKRDIDSISSDSYNSRLRKSHRSRRSQESSGQCSSPSSSSSRSSSYIEHYDCKRRSRERRQTKSPCRRSHRSHHDRHSSRSKQYLSNSHRNRCSHRSSTRSSSSSSSSHARKAKCLSRNIATKINKRNKRERISEQLLHSQDVEANVSSQPANSIVSVDNREVVDYSDI